jgi:hypothetical protein
MVSDTSNLSMMGHGKTAIEAVGQELSGRVAERAAKIPLGRWQVRNDQSMNKLSSFKLQGNHCDSVWYFSKWRLGLAGHRYALGGAGRRR